jgi:hypothetical protein
MSYDGWAVLGRGSPWSLWETPSAAPTGRNSRLRRAFPSGHRDLTSLARRTAGVRGDPVIHDRDRRAPEARREWRGAASDSFACKRASAASASASSRCACSSMATFPHFSPAYRPSAAAWRGSMRSRSPPGARGSRTPPSGRGRSAPWACPSRQTSAGKAGIIAAPRFASKLGPWPGGDGRVRHTATGHRRIGRGGWRGWC